jgi:hypothetical protein
MKPLVGSPVVMRTPTAIVCVACAPLIARAVSTQVPARRKLTNTCIGSVRTTVQKLASAGATADTGLNMTNVYGVPMTPMVGRAENDTESATIVIFCLLDSPV